jgi:hypothetical protein
MSSNPFFPYKIERIEEGIRGAAAETPIMPGNSSPQNTLEAIKIKPSTMETTCPRIGRNRDKGGIVTKTEDNPMHLKTREPSPCAGHHAA